MHFGDQNRRLPQGRKNRALVSLLAVLIVISPSNCPAASYEQEIAVLSARLADNIGKSGKKTVAVVDFTNLEGEVIELGRFLAEEFSVALTQKAAGFEVIDRTYLKAIIQEHKLSATGLIDPLTARKLGQFAGVEALVTGSITPLGDSVRVSVKILDTTTARVIAAATADIPKTKAIEELLSKSVQNNSSGEAAPPQAVGRPPDTAGRQIQENEMLFQLRRCSRSDKTVTCLGAITDKATKSRALWLDLYATYLLDDLGNQYKYPHLGLQLGAQGTQQSLEPELPMNFSVSADNADSEARSFSVVLSYGFQQSDPDRRVTAATVALRGIPIQQR